MSSFAMHFDFSAHNPPNRHHLWMVTDMFSLSRAVQGGGAQQLPGGRVRARAEGGLGQGLLRAVVLQGQPCSYDIRKIVLRNWPNTDNIDITQGEMHKLYQQTFRDFFTFPPSPCQDQIHVTSLSLVRKRDNSMLTSFMDAPQPPGRNHP